MQFANAPTALIIRVVFSPGAGRIVHHFYDLGHLSVANLQLDFRVRDAVQVRSFNTTGVKSLHYNHGEGLCRVKFTETERWLETVLQR